MKDAIIAHEKFEYRPGRCMCLGADHADACAGPICIQGIRVGARQSVSGAPDRGPV